MKILHGTWIPDDTLDFTQSGCFYLWVETDQLQPKDEDWHRYHLGPEALTEFLVQDIGLPLVAPSDLDDEIVPMFFLMPTVKDSPLPSLELSRYLETDLSSKFTWAYWSVHCYRVGCYRKGNTVFEARLGFIFQLLRDLHFLVQNQWVEVQLGSDLWFWYHFLQGIRAFILKDQYIPSLQYKQLDLPGKKQTSKKTATPVEIYSGWEMVSEAYEAFIARSLEALPLSCTSGFIAYPEQPVLHDGESLLRHCTEVLLANVIQTITWPDSYLKKIADTLIEQCLDADRPVLTDNLEHHERFGQWWQWRDRISRSQAAQSFQLYFVLASPDQPEDPWALRFHVAPTSDPSLRLALGDYWQSSEKRRQDMQTQLGEDLEQKLLFQLGYAARMYPELWAGLETDEPQGILLSLEQAFDFLQETAWVLEDAGFRVIVPAWWTPQGQRRIKMRLRPHSPKKSSASAGKGRFSLDQLMDYTYELSIGDETVSEADWMKLVNAKVPLVKFRGEWLQLDQTKMQEMLAFWKKSPHEGTGLTILDLMRYSSEESGEFEVDTSRDRTLTEMLSKLNHKSQLEAISDLKDLKGTLRDYQKRGVSWLSYLESLGLNGCLADDMGLGKTVQVIARLVQERSAESSQGKQRKKEQHSNLPPTLLIAPTSVLGNWFKELEKFAPQLKGWVHHGSQRVKTAKDFQRLCQSQDIIITSFSLVRLDEKLFQSVSWHRIVLDEAQNIKNPKAAQTKAILKLDAPHRLAMTGTPVENRLLDLWSIFNFLNPGYLGKEAQFQKTFERPIQRNNDRIMALRLKKMVEPFILRRVKTDPSIIRDLPDKVEQKLFCNLTQEQASLYEAVIQNIGEALEHSDGIQRQGLMLSTLLKLKQICNHPRQFLQDESEFTPARSHKLSRLCEMVAEAIEERESLLVFTQFTEIGGALEQYLRQTLFFNTYYIHGSTSRKKREQMITEFQDEQTPPSVFILSLKAGGVGITLTKANHVFHFDRWWNPAVEDQATDRAFRIGQKKNVFVHKFVAIGTLEERIDAMIEDKKRLAGTVVGADESWLTQLDNEAFKDLIALNRSAVLD